MNDIYISIDIEDPEKEDIIYSREYRLERLPIKYLFKSMREQYGKYTEKVYNAITNQSVGWLFEENFTDRFGYHYTRYIWVTFFRKEGESREPVSIKELKEVLPISGGR